MSHKMIKKACVRVEYYKPTAADGDNELFATKIRNIMHNISESDREAEFGESHINFEVTESSNRFMGSLRVLRQSTPRKGRLGTNATSDLGLGEDEGVCEISHFIYDQEVNRLAMQYNYYGPKVSHLFNLVNRLYDKISADSPRCSYYPIVTDSKLSFALESGDIHAVVARPKHPVADDLVPADMNWQQLYKTYNLPDNTSMTISLNNRNGGLRDSLQSFLSHRDGINQYDKLEVSMVNPESGKVEKYDLIKNKLQTKLFVPLINNKEIDTELLRTMMVEDFNRLAEMYD